MQESEYGIMARLEYSKDDMIANLFRWVDILEKTTTEDGFRLTKEGASSFRYVLLTVIRGLNSLEDGFTWENKKSYTEDEFLEKWGMK